ncbi:RNase adapter RapZ [Shimia sp. R9_1]|uniref:RNase adapter RapZ n=1 Tax=unclassified Shimia TaxID=2630038 RepID=UPI001ADA1B73|nr:MULTISPECIES: RNase adapter RapZ [unclassified Shimia]MBO9395928.1 RNase adapter RapZ [Shimia sp. R9_2]MBO9400058.1 RNase adapter RapZ [Shimia sp. R9_3]MBO9407942.1 RNase adapter RapZ [Shimia sp. R9_1]
MPASDKPFPLVLLTGPSGAGRSTAIKALEDVGYETIDNLPLGLLERLLSGQPLRQPMALGLDVRNRDFSPDALLAAMEIARGIPNAAADLLYLDCRAEVLRRRYNETRRSHPMARQEDPTEGIERELSLLSGVRTYADVLIDTSELSPHELRQAVQARFSQLNEQAIGLTIQSFSYKRGLPQGADIVVDCRFLHNPHWQEDLRALDGGDAAVGAYVSEDPGFAPFMERMEQMVEGLLPGYIREGRSHLMIAFGCTGGKHRSVFVTETMAESLANRGWQVSIRHRELNRFASLPARIPVSQEDGEHTV